MGVGGWGGGGILIFSCICRLKLFLWGQNFEFQYFCAFSEKNNIFGGMKLLWLFLGGHHKIRLVLGVIYIHFRVFS